MTLSDKQRLDRVEQTAERHAQALAELLVMVKGHWTGPENSAASQILREQRLLAEEQAEREASIRDEEQARADAKVTARLAETSS